MAKFLYLNPSLCTGCRSCESICTVTNEKVINRAKSRIRVYRMDVLELRFLYCDQCEDRPCLAACPLEAIVVEGGQVRVDESRCNGCGLCTKACDKLFIAPAENRILMCNQCGACVKNCPEGALEMRIR